MSRLLLAFTCCIQLTFALADGDARSRWAPQTAEVPNNCTACDPHKCPVAPSCQDTIVKDDCNCCLICPSTKAHPVMPPRVCNKVNCKARKICMVNIQGLPLCKCPSDDICKRDEREPTCGSDRVLYYSKCHKRLQECRKGKKINEFPRKECTFRQTRKGIVPMRQRRKGSRAEKKPRRRHRRPSLAARNGDALHNRQSDQPVDAISNKSQGRQKASANTPGQSRSLSKHRRQRKHRGERKGGNKKSRKSLRRKLRKARRELNELKKLHLMARSRQRRKVLAVQGTV